MNKREALRILIECASRDAGGAGQGFRTIPSYDKTLIIRDAVIKIYKDAYGFEIDDNTLRNLNLPSQNASVSKK